MSTWATQTQPRLHNPHSPPRVSTLQRWCAGASPEKRDMGLNPATCSAAMLKKPVMYMYMVQKVSKSSKSINKATNYKLNPRNNYTVTHVYTDLRMFTRNCRLIYTHSHEIKHDVTYHYSKWCFLQQISTKITQNWEKSYEKPITFTGKFLIRKNHPETGHIQHLKKRKLTIVENHRIQPSKW